MSEPYKRPSNEMLEKAMNEVILRNINISSQNEFAQLVMKELNRGGEKYRVSGERIRVLAATRGLVIINVGYKRARTSSLPENCPVCKHEMKPILNSTLDGGTVELKRRCPFCNYTAEIGGNVPGRYMFIRKTPVTTEERIRRLEEAAEYLKVASELIEGSIDGHTIHIHAREAVFRINKIIESEDSSSINNLILTVKADEGAPCWTRPFASVKNTNRKDM